MAERRAALPATASGGPVAGPMAAPFGAPAAVPGTQPGAQPGGEMDGMMSHEKLEHPSRSNESQLFGI